MDIQLAPKAPKMNLSTPGGVSQHTIFEVILLVAVSILFFIFILQPKRSELVQAQNQVDALKTQNDTVQKNKDTLVSLVGQLNSHGEDVADLDEALPLDGRITLFRLALESLIDDAGMTVGDISIQSSDDGGDVAGNKAVLSNPYGQPRKLQQFTGSVSVTGTLEQFQALLQKIEDNGRVIDVTAFDISTAPNALTFHVSLQSYFYE